ncbi:hypothetical protein [uncultured Sphaerochaeta sp.]|uniref:hypothetical protein n=1 Tax=uncultured Sphaerochaeta sp. TaxID=886478 RepID=UPI002A0A8E28|nr:hypothetical protein [uncultured Sphaerochaeta sp.]
MIFTKKVCYEDIRKQLDKDTDTISLVGCETCARVAGTGGQARMKELALQLRKDGYKVKDGFLIPTVCTPKLGFAKVGSDVNTILSLACNAGTSNIRRFFPNCKIVETTEDVGLMIEDAKEETLQITMSYDKFTMEIGNTFEAFTGVRKDSINAMVSKEAR